MSKPPHEQQQAQQAQQARQAEQQRAREAEQRRAREVEQKSQKSHSSDQTQTVQPETIVTSDAKRQTKKSPGMKSEPLKVTAGRAGERNIVVKRIMDPTRVDGSPWFSFALTCAFEAKTLPGNALEVTMEQLQYRKAHAGTGSLHTPLIPVAPIGTKGKVIARDVTTGEVAEQGWTWFLLGGGGGFSLWKAIKRLFWKSD